jgi:hypothetical protein
MAYSSGEIDLLEPLLATGSWDLRLSPYLLDNQTDWYYWGYSLTQFLTRLPTDVQLWQ